MTRVDVAAPQAVPTGGAAGNGSRRLASNGDFGEADAGFLAQLATAAAEGEASGVIPRSADAGEAAIARWWQRQAEGRLPPALPEDQADGRIPEIAGAVADDAVAEMPLPAAAPVDPPSDTDVEPQTGDDQQSAPQAKEPAASVGVTLPTAGAPPIATPVAPVALAPPARPAAPADPRQANVPTEPLPAVEDDRPPQTKLPVVTVVRRETHLAPVQATPVAAALPASRPVPTEGGRATASRKQDQPVEGPKPVSVPTSPSGQRGQAAEHLPTQAVSDRPREGAPQPQRDGDGENLAPATPLSARSIGHAVHQPAAPTQQIADTIAASLSSADTADPQAAPATTAPRPGLMQAVKVLTIQLQPADLGTVTVRMRLKADTMEVEVAADRRATARLIDGDRDTLASLLRSAGYHVEGLTVRAVDQPGTASSPGAMPGSPEPGPQLQPGGGQPDARPSGGRAQPDHRGDTQLPNRSDNDSEQATGNRRGAGLYV